MKIISWNVNSVRARIQNIINYINEAKPDILLLQEIKTQNETFPYDNFNDLGFTFFNTTGTTDVTTNTSSTRDDFIEHEYSAKDLQEFISFQIKIRLQATDSSRPPIVKRLRAIATV